MTTAAQLPSESRRDSEALIQADRKIDALEKQARDLAAQVETTRQQALAQSNERILALEQKALDLAQLVETARQKTLLQSELKTEAMEQKARDLAAFVETLRSQTRLQSETEIEALVEKARELALFVENVRKDTRMKSDAEKAALLENARLSTLSARVAADLKIAIAERDFHYRRLFEAAKDGILVLDSITGKITDCNPFLLKLLGYLREEMLGKELWEIGLFKNIATSKAAFIELQKNGYIRFEDMPLETKDGRSIAVEFVSNTYRVNDKLVMQCNIRDISEHRSLETKLRQAQKMEGIGQLAGGIAHDFNNLLTVINGRSQLVIDRFKPGDKTRSDLELIYKAGERAASLTRQLLAFSRQQVLEPVVLDLNALSADMEKMLRRLVPENIGFSTVFDPALKRVKADPGQLEQVILNLVVNARDAMPNGGKLTIETANAELNEEYCRTHADVNSGHYVMLAVSDCGHGMDAATKNRIFEPFFTTKPQGKGTGLGLSTVFGIVKQSNGHIEVYSEVGRGSTFKVYLPQTYEKLVAAATESQSLAPVAHAVILVVEDEEGVRELVRDLLEANGYTVFVAQNGKEALSICSLQKAAINLVVTDVVMPEMGGPELAEHLKKSRPAIKVLFMSGYADHAIVHNGTLAAGASFIQKPFTLPNFARKVREVLERV